MKIPSTVTSVDMQTGEETTKRADWTLVPPSPDRCPVCAWDHDPLQPHNNQTLYYRYAFRSRNGRDPTWADCMAHCEPAVIEAWRAKLIEGGHWTEPGGEPIKHLGPEPK